MQTILGAGGAIGTELAKALTVYTKDIRLVSRNPKKVNETDTLFAGDLTKDIDVKNAVKGSEVVYLTAGLPYNTKFWQSNWPVIMQNVINACIENKSRLVFFDNIYMYDGKDLNPITETTTINPPSRKGKVRADIVKMIWNAVQNQGLVALIARAADFYGPSVKNVSVLTETVIKPLSEGKTANWLVGDQFRHSYTYTIDAGKATALLGNSPDAFGETWHLPTAKDPWTGKEWIEVIARELGVKPRHRTVSKTLVKLMGIFLPVMRESHEMLYQYDKDYVFNSDKFESRFSFKPTPYITGIKEIVRVDYKK
ncbi:MAG TPA: NAD-dependent epimerase/dehydratase family protein [Chryseolinea sp.]|nr:NAD-dependent epimerase/dehydratase family protein [Chryseolinea sp.]